MHPPASFSWSINLWKSRTLSFSSHASSCRNSEEMEGQCVSKWGEGEASPPSRRSRWPRPRFKAPTQLSAFSRPPGCHGGAGALVQPIACIPTPGPLHPHTSPTWSSPRSNTSRCSRAAARRSDAMKRAPSLARPPLGGGVAPQGCVGTHVWGGGARGEASARPRADLWHPCNTHIAAYSPSRPRPTSGQRGSPESDPKLPIRPRPAPTCCRPPS
jgi:hypothetical protein